MRLKDQLLALSEAYCGAVGLKETYLSTRVFGSGARLKRLRAGKDMLSTNVEDGVQWFSDNWPDLTVAWPSCVPRPAPSLGSAAYERLHAQASVAA